MAVARQRDGGLDPIQPQKKPRGRPRKIVDLQAQASAQAAAQAAAPKRSPGRPRKDGAPAGPRPPGNDMPQEMADRPSTPPV